MGRLAKKAGKKPGALSEKTSVPFIICFRPKLFNGYSFKEMDSRKLKEWQNFLDAVSQLTFQQVEERYKRKSDSADTYDDQQIIHYGFGDGFRIHGIIENGQFVVLRLDPYHKIHDK